MKPALYTSAATARGERGIVLAMVMMLLLIVALAGALAVWGLKTEISAAGNDRLSRQMVDCAEQGLAFGKQYFTGAGLDWATTLSYKVCSTTKLPCWGAGGPFPDDSYGTPVAPPAWYPLTGTMVFGGISLRAEVAIFDDNDISEATQNYRVDANSQVFVWSRCTDPQSGQSKSVQALIRASVPTNNDYSSQAGLGYRNQGNGN
jgi:hypothetical protein